MKTEKITKKHANRMIKYQLTETINRMRNKKKPIMNAMVQLAIDVPIEFVDIQTQYSSEVIAFIRKNLLEYGLTMGVLEMEEEEHNTHNAILLKGLIERKQNHLLLC